MPVTPHDPRLVPPTLDAIYLDMGDITEQMCKTHISNSHLCQVSSLCFFSYCMANTYLVAGE